MFCWKKFEYTRNWNSPCSPYSSEITSQLPILWTLVCSLLLYFEVFVNSWTVSLDHAKVHARTSRIRCWRSSKRKRSGGMATSSDYFIGKCSSRKPTERTSPKNFNFAERSVIACNRHISATSIICMQIVTFNHCAVDDPHLGDLPRGTPRQVPSVTDEADIDTTRSCRKPASSGKGVTFRPFKRLFSKQEWPQKIPKVSIK